MFEYLSLKTNYFFMILHYNLKNFNFFYLFYYYYFDLLYF